MSESATRDKRGVAWLNELGVLLALAQDGNRPMYVAEIANKGPKIWSLPREEMNYFTKPGIKNACLRLKEADILEHRMNRTPKKRELTEHYSIKGALDGLAAIYAKYGSGVLSLIRESDFGQRVIASDLSGYLKKKLGASRDLKIMVKGTELREIEYMVRISNRALETLLRNDIFLDITERREESVRMAAAIHRLWEVMHFALALDLATRPPTEIIANGWTAKIELITKYKHGSTELNMRSSFDSEEFMKAQKNLLDHCKPSETENEQ